MCRQLLDFELDAAIAHFDPEDRFGLRVVPPYDERYILLAPDDQVMPLGHSMSVANLGR